MRPGDTAEVVVSLVTVEANGLAAGVHTDTVRFGNQTAGTITDRAVQLQIDAPSLGFLAVAGTNGLLASGPLGGPFVPGAID